MSKIVLCDNWDLHKTHNHGDNNVCPGVDLIPGGCKKKKKHTPHRWVTPVGDKMSCNGLGVKSVIYKDISSFGNVIPIHKNCPKFYDQIDHEKHDWIEFDGYTYYCSGYVTFTNPYEENGWGKGWINKQMADHDPVNHPSHYTSHPSGVECIDITRHMNFNLGNVVKYVWRAGIKEEAPTIQDLEKAAWYLNDEIAQRKKEE